jgi:hypothetical protein
MGKVGDSMRIKLLDNLQYQIADATDCVRMKTRKTYEGDDISWICERADVVNLIFPPMTDIPVRKIRKDGRASGYQITSLVSAMDDGEQVKLYTVQVPINSDIDVGDLIFRIVDVGRSDFALVTMLQVSELLGTFGHSHIIMQKVNMTIPTETPPTEIIDTMVQVAQRRQMLGF